MRLLLDTHIVIWAALAPDELTVAERGRMAGAATPLVPSAVLAFAAAIDWELLPLTAHHAAAGLGQPLGHKDPFDELLSVQAQEEAMHLLTCDSKLIGHPFAISGSREPESGN